MKLYKEQIEALIELVGEARIQNREREYEVDQINYNILQVNLEEMLEEAQ